VRARPPDCMDSSLERFALALESPLRSSLRTGDQHRRPCCIKAACSRRNACRQVNRQALRSSCLPVNAYGAPAAGKRRFEPLLTASEAVAVRQPLRPRVGSIVVTTSGGCMATAQPKVRPEPVPALPRRWSGSGGFFWPVCRCSYPGTTETPLSGAVPGFGTVRRLFSARERAPASCWTCWRCRDRSRAGDSWLGNGPRCPGEQARPPP